MRIRSIKPEFWTSEDVASLPWEHRLLFIGLWSYVDDNGVGRDVERLIASSLFPLEEDPRETLATVSRGLQWLDGQGLVTRYEVDGRPLLYITAWDKHQRIDKPNKPRYEPPTCENAVIRETLSESSRDPRDIPAPGAGEQGSRGAGDLEIPPPAAPTPIDPPGFADFYDAYPRKGGKGDARRAYVKARRKVAADVLLDAVKRYADFRADKDPQFTPEAGPWLNKERWDDELVQPAPRRSASDTAVLDALAYMDPTQPMPAGMTHTREIGR